MERTAEGATIQTVELVNQINALAGQLPISLRKELEVVLHKMTYPMTEILARVPGTSVTERAKKLRVSRQTVYVWMSERFRPTLPQAKRIAKVTGVPVEHILENGFEQSRRKARKKIARVAAGRKTIARTPKRAAPKRRRKAAGGDGATAA